MLSHTAFVGVGSNLGQKLDNCLRGIAALTSCEHSRLLNQSRQYRTEPVDYLDQDWFVNCAVQIETCLDPFELLSVLQDIQKKAGRVQDAIRFGPRVLDMDVIFFDETVIDHPELTLPHPRMHLRRFVLKPLCDMDPGLRHPILRQTVQQLLDNLEDAGQGIVELS
ncbi:MAG: 2-amino-4-hydroxy-6-hydroxymethyldihydropteridine diphosphokinase [Desulfatirhabdiaceae bacterium]|nr:2-amino-4-hydroxy-6-hydroxymethyldihydropteridine diphosphokinase [Desulfatirhabdiaceae bacterium]